MTKAALILVALATATAAFASAPAHAGGKRLQFGGPLGSFVATPFAKSAAHNTHSNNRAQAAKQAAQRRAAAKKTAARNVHAKKVAAQQAAARNAQQKIAVAKVETSTETKSDWKAPVRASAIAGTNTLNLNTNDKPAEARTEVAKDEPIQTASFQKEPAEVAELECKRYIPSAGMTITVPCGR
ncbi:MAG: hypothetical protein APF80_05740 [Alphaproteobacteria bacterium BRH_c36]|nr:MAG: hypothetical protein APF80_05740 [Alphaproteobacteria bacterium BRH_c36]